MAPTPTTLMITDGCQGNAEDPVVKSWAFQLTTDEARAMADVVIGMCYIPIFYIFSFYAYIYYDIV